MATRKDQSEVAQLQTLIENYEAEQSNTLSLLASANYSSQHIRNFSASTLSDITTEGYPGKRYHPGARYADEVEDLACALAKKVFRSSYANVQPHSASSANSAILIELLQPGDVLTGLELSAGGHLTHGASPSFSGRLFDSKPYRLVGETIDYDYILDHARTIKPRVIICGASAYPRKISFKNFREIADQVNAILLADISHISGFVAANLHESPIEFAHAVTTSTYKQLAGPRGGIILASGESVPGTESRNIGNLLDHSVFPRTQGTPDLANIAAKGATLAFCLTPDFQQRMQLTLNLATQLSQELTSNGFRLVAGGTDTHMVVIDLRKIGISGKYAEEILESVGILANRNLIPDDQGSPKIPSGLRLGTNTLATRGFDIEGVSRIVRVISRLLKKGPTADLRSAKLEVESICYDYPIPRQGT